MTFDDHVSSGLGGGARRPLNAPRRTRSLRNSFHFSSSDAGMVPADVRHLRYFCYRVRSGKSVLRGAFRGLRAPPPSPDAPDVRNFLGTVRLHLRCRKRARPRAHLHHCPRRFSHAYVHARGHLRHGEGDHHRPAARARQPGGAREHLPLGHAPRRGAGGRSRGHPPLHELRRPHAHRLRRLPSIQPRRHREAL